MTLVHEYRSMLIGDALNPYITITTMQTAAPLINAFRLQAQETPSVTKVVKVKLLNLRTSSGTPLAGRVLPPTFSFSSKATWLVIQMVRFS